MIAQGKLSSVALSLFTEVRHRLTSIVISGQLPFEFPDESTELSTGLSCGQIEGADSYDAICRMKPTMRKVSRETLAKLRCGEVVVNFRDASDERYRGEPLLIKIRPSCAQSGGQTLSAVDEAEE